jgi:hypothetical protein
MTERWSDVDRTLRGSLGLAAGTGIGAEGCINVNECIEETHNCHTNAACIDTDGSFECACNAGYGAPPPPLLGEECFEATARRNRSPPIVEGRLD